MPCTVFDSAIYKDCFSDERMRAIFDDDNLLAKFIDVEAALAQAEAEFGIVPEEVAATIRRCCRPESFDRERLTRDTALVGYPVLPVVRQMEAMCGEAGRWLHWGATTQDVTDTAAVLQIREALEAVEERLGNVRRSLVCMARRYRDAPMAGRTHLQQALPITWGYKCAIWIEQINRHLSRLGELRSRVLVGELAGAVGTLASLAGKGAAVQKRFCEILGLNHALTPWHVARDGFGELAGFMAVMTGTLGKIALDVMLLSTNEIDEVAEPFVKGRGSSSTMPQKRNPIGSEIVLACVKTCRQACGALLDAQVQDLERGTGPWHAEWAAMPEMFLLASGALKHADELLAGLEVHEETMRRNLGLTRGLIMAEAVQMALAPYVGRTAAHDIIYAACRTVNIEGGTLSDALSRVPEVTRHLTGEEIRRLCDPAGYLGECATIVDNVLAASERQDSAH